MGIIYFKNKKINIGPAVKKQATLVQPEIIVLPQSPAAASNVFAQQVCIALHTFSNQAPRIVNLQALKLIQRFISKHFSIRLCSQHFMITLAICHNSLGVSMTVHLLPCPRDCN